jgi:outer membrane protein OmpA-like peptidoglycan-associated protein
MRTILFTIAFIALTAGSAAAQAPSSDAVAIEVEFRSNGSALTRPARRVLADVADRLRAQPHLHVHFTVYGADSKDPLVTATARADAIAAFLARRGVHPRRVHAFGVREVAGHATVRWSHARVSPPKRLSDPAGAATASR